MFTSTQSIEQGHLWDTHSRGLAQDSHLINGHCFSLLPSSPWQIAGTPICLSHGDCKRTNVARLAVRVASQRVQLHAVYEGNA